MSEAEGRKGWRIALRVMRRRHARRQEAAIERVLLESFVRALERDPHHMAHLDPEQSEGNRPSSHNAVSIAGSEPAEKDQ